MGEDRPALRIRSGGPGLVSGTFGRVVEELHFISCSWCTVVLLLGSPSLVLLRLPGDKVRNFSSLVCNLRGDLHRLRAIGNNPILV